MAENRGDVLDRDPSGLLLMLMCCVQTVYKTEYSKTKTLKYSWKMKSCRTGSLICVYVKYRH